MVRFLIKFRGVICVALLRTAPVDFAGYEICLRVFVCSLAKAMSKSILGCKLTSFRYCSIIPQRLLYGPIQISVIIREGNAYPVYCRVQTSVTFCYICVENHKPVIMEKRNCKGQLWKSSVIIGKDVEHVFLYNFLQFSNGLFFSIFTKVCLTIQTQNQMDRQTYSCTEQIVCKQTEHKYAERWTCNWIKR